MIADKTSTQDRPLVSVVTVVYNGEKQIEATLQSIFSQTYQNIESVIIDGGSSDHTLEIIKKYQNNISFWLSEPDRGIAHAWNKGLERCSGDIVGILNVGDSYHPEAIRLAVEEFQKNQDVGFVFGDMLVCNEKGKPRYKIKGNINYLENIDYEMAFVPHPTVFVKRSIYETEGLYDESYQLAMDYEFLLRITKRGIVGRYIPDILTTMSLGGASDQKYRQCYKEMMQISVAHGYNKKLALVRYYYNFMKTFLRKRMENVRLSSVIKWFRVCTNKSYDY